MSIAREAVQKRYALLPLWYTMFYEHEIFGTPVMRPMLANYPLDSKVFKLDDQYMLSDKLLVRPVLDKGATSVTVTFPSTDGAHKGDLWYDTDDYKKIETVGAATIAVDSQKIPVYQRGGTIIPKKETVRKSSAYMVDDPISLVVAADAANAAEGTLFIDDEQSFDYRTGKYLYLKFELKNKILTNKFVESTAKYDAKSTIDKITFAGLTEVPEYATLKAADGKETRLDITKDAATPNFFRIEKLTLPVTEEWSLELNGVGQKVASLGLLLAALIVHLFKYL